MSVLAKRELLVQVAPHYVEGCRHQRRVILDEFVAATGYERKYAIRLLNSPVRPPLVIQRRRAPRYGAAVQEALMVVWRMPAWVRLTSDEVVGEGRSAAVCACEMTNSRRAMVAAFAPRSASAAT
jgi:hypothetical protein